jgi:hypothetical protein
MGKIIKFLLPDIFYKTFVIKLVFLPERLFLNNSILS